MLAIIGGSGLAGIDGCELRGQQTVTTPFGEPSAPLQRLRCEEKDFLFLARHGNPHTIPPHRINYRANLFALKNAGATNVLAINTVGGISPDMKAGHFAVPHDVVDYTYGREHTFSDGSPGSILQHVDFSEPFDRRMRDSLCSCLKSMSVAFSDKGVYAATQGPRLESPAEIRRLERDGCDIVGMTGMPEASLARELGLHYAMLCLVVNRAAGKSAGEISMTDIRRVLDSGMQKMNAVISAFIRAGLDQGA